MVEINLPGRYDVIFSGHVQGVGFRYTTRLVARNYSVTGFVQNLADGTVRLVIEGAIEEMNELLAAIKEQMADAIQDICTRREDPRGEFQGFEVRT